METAVRQIATQTVPVAAEAVVRAAANARITIRAELRSGQTEGVRPARPAAAAVSAAILCRRPAVLRQAVLADADGAELPEHSVSSTENLQSPEKRLAEQSVKNMKR